MRAEVATPAAFRLVPPASGRLESLAFATVLLALVAATTGYALLKPQRAGPTLLSWQVSSFDGLSAVDQAIHSALLPAAEELVWNNDETGNWLTVEKLEAALMPPFHRDHFWASNGQVRWQLVLPGANTADAGPAAATPADADPAGHSHSHAQQTEDALDFLAMIDEAQAQLPPELNAVYEGTQGQGAASYYGSGGTLPGQSAYLVVIGHVHSGAYWINQASIWIHRDPDAPFPGILKPEGLVSRGWRQVVPYTGRSEVERVKGTGS